MKSRNVPATVLGTVALAALATPAGAATWQKEPSYGVEIGYNDNYTLQPEPEDADGQEKTQAVSTARAKLGLSLIQEKPAFSAKLQAQLIATSYSGDVDGYVRTRPLPGGGKEPVTDADGRVELEGARLSDRVDGSIVLGMEGRKERSEWRLDASVLTDSLLQEIDLDTGANGGVGPDNNNDNGTVREDVTRTQLNIRPSFLYRSSPISWFRTSLTLTSASYDNTPGTSLQDYNEQRVRGLYSREFTPVNSWQVDAEARNYKADDDRQFDSAVVGLGLTHKFSETTSFGLRVAQSTTSYDSRTSEGGTVSGRATKPLVQLTGRKDTGRATYSLRLGAELYGSASGDVVRADELLFNAVYQYSELMTLSFRSKLFQNKSLRDKIAGDDAYNDVIDNSNRRYLAIEPTVNWRFSRWWKMDAGLRYQREKRDNLGNPGEGSYLFVGVTYAKPLGLQVGN